MFDVESITTSKANYFCSKERGHFSTSQLNALRKMFIFLDLTIMSQWLRMLHVTLYSPMFVMESVGKNEFEERTQ